MKKGKTHFVGGPTTMVDIYEAAGGVASKDRQTVTIDSRHGKPFDIKLRVCITGIRIDSDGERVVLGVLLHDDVYLEEGLGGTSIRKIDYDVQLELPVGQIQIFKED
jgi:hypothetical protein